MTQKIIIKICAVISGISGLMILFSTVYPIASYEWKAQQRYPTLISPLVDEDKASFKFDKTDYTKASNWFEGTENNDSVEVGVKYFTLTIPKLGIDNATVVVSGDDLSDHLIQYPGTALPGKVGNTVIFGHSILPQYFDPDNYLSIFSTLPTLEEGDLVYANYDGIFYKFQVEDMFEVKPADIQVLEQNSTGSYMTLITCTPPGHPLKPRRLIVRTKLVPATASL